jgi:murein L,D-transpeptidase YcbB/YkuD
VIFEYYTASVDDAGEIRFHPDVYDYDYLELVGPLLRRHKRQL